MNNQHHAELVRSSRVADVNLDETSPDKDIQDRYFEKFGIDDARELVRQANNKPPESEFLNLIVRADFITVEAQNALLKILEEPPKSTMFTFVIPPDLNVLPTLQSRFHNVIIEEAAADNSTFSEFLTGNYAERLSLIDKAAKSKDTPWMRSIKQGLIDHVSESKIDSDSIRELEFVTCKLLTRGASNKMLLEHAALVLGTRL